MCYVLLLSVVACLHAQIPSIVQSPDVTPRPTVDYPEEAYYALGIPEPISKAEINLFGGIMHLSEEQMLIFRQNYEQYLDRTAIYRAREETNFYQYSALVHALKPNHDLEAAQQFADLISHRQKIVNSLADEETKFLAALAPILHEDQLYFLERVKSSRIRSRNILSSPKYPGSNLDLLLLINSVCLEQEQDFSELLTRNEVVNAELTLYDLQVTPLFVRLAEQKYQNSVKDTIHNAEWMAEWRHTEAFQQASTELKVERYNEYQLARRGILTAAVKTAKSIHDLNRQFLESINRALDPTLSKAIQGKFFRYAYPQIFPDHDDLDALFQFILENPSLAAKTRKDCTDLRLSFRDEHEFINRALIKHYLDQKELTKSTNTTNNNQLRAFRDKMNQLLLRRRNTTRQYISLLKQIDDIELEEETARVLSEWESTFQGSFAPYRTGYANIDSNEVK